MKNVVLLVAFLSVVGLALTELADATMSRTSPVDPDSRLELIVEASVVREPNMSVEEVASALLLACRVQVDARLVEQGFQRLGHGRFRVVIRPAVNESDRRQLHGCIEDARIQHLQADVIAMRELR